MDFNITRSAMIVTLTIHLVVGCENVQQLGEVRIPELTLVGGTRVGDLLGGTDSAIVSVYSPMDCLNCNSAMDRWRQWSQARVGRVHVVLMLRDPTPAERRALAMDRLTDYRVLEPGQDIAAPASFLVVSGAIVDFGRGLIGERALAKRVILGSR